MNNVAFKGEPVPVEGDMPKVGDPAPAFSLTGADLSEVSADQFKGQWVVLSIVPSLDTGVCAASARRFNEAIAAHPSAVLVNVSMDLPFAQKRFCDAEKLGHIVTLSAFRSPDFARAYGVALAEGPLKGLLARAVIVIDPEGRVAYAARSPEIAEEPDYDAALSVLPA